MSAATIELTGIGHVEINTEEKEVMFCGAMSADGQPVNCTSKKVSRSKANAAAAIKNREHVLSEIKPGYFKLA